MSAENLNLFNSDESGMLFDVTPVPNQFLIEYMPAAKAEYVRVYLYGLVYSRHPAAGITLEKMARDLELTEEEIERAMRYWERKRLVERVQDHPPAYRYRNFVEAVYLNGGKEIDPDYLQFRDAVFDIFDEESVSEKRVADLYEWEKDLGLPRPVVLALIRWLKETRGRKFAVKTGERYAALLLQQGAVTPEEALEVLSRDQEIAKGARRICRKLAIKREANDGEQQLYAKWLREWGYTAEAVEWLCDREAPKSQTPTFAYLDAILRKQHAAGDKRVTREELERRVQTEEPLRELLRTLNVRGLTVNAGTKEVYEHALRAVYPDDGIILLAGQTCARSGGDLTAVQALLEHWKRQGYATEEEIRAELQRKVQPEALLRRLYAMWGKPAAAGEVAVRTVRNWLENWHCMEALILHCAAYANGKDDPLRYLNSTLERCVKEGIFTPEQAEQASEERKARRGAAAGVKSDAARRYEQRPAAAAADLPDWMLEELKEEERNAQ